MFVVLANLVDTATTIFAVGRGVPEENPFMAALIGLNPIAFIAVKIAYVTAALIFLIRFRCLNLAYYGLMLLAVAYAALMVHEAVFWCFFT
jgi:hypothetical protein